MNQSDITSLIDNLIEAVNAYDTDKYLSFYAENAVLEDPSVGSTFTGHREIREYFEKYFIGYKTQTKLEKLEINKDEALLEVRFAGEFPGGVIKGTFDFNFSDGKIAAAKADLI